MTFLGLFFFFIALLSSIILFMQIIALIGACHANTLNNKPLPEVATSDILLLFFTPFIWTLVFYWYN